MGSLLPNWEILNSIGLMLTLSAWTGFLFGGRGRALTTCLILGSLALTASFVSILSTFAITPSMPPWTKPILIAQPLILVAAWIPSLRLRQPIWIVGFLLASVVFEVTVYKPILRASGDPMMMSPGLPAGPPPAARPTADVDPKNKAPMGPLPFETMKSGPPAKKYVPPVPKN